MKLQGTSRLHETSWDFTRLHETSWDFMRHHETSWEFNGLHETSWDFKRLQETSRDFMRLQETSETFQTSFDFTAEVSLFLPCENLTPTDFKWLQLTPCDLGQFKSKYFIRFRLTSTDFMKSEIDSSLAFTPLPLELSSECLANRINFLESNNNHPVRVRWVPSIS